MASYKLKFLYTESCPKLSTTDFRKTKKAVTQSCYRPKLISFPHQALCAFILESQTDIISNESMIHITKIRDPKNKNRNKRSSTRLILCRKQKNELTVPCQSPR